MQQSVRLDRVLLVASVSALIPLAGNVIAAFVTHRTGIGSWLIVPIVGVGVAVVKIVLDAHAAPDRPGGPRETPRIIALVVSVLVLGIGGLGVAEGTRRAVASGIDDKYVTAAKRFALEDSDVPAGYKKDAHHAWSRDRCLKPSTKDEAAFAARWARSGLEACAASTYHNHTERGDDTYDNDIVSSAIVFGDDRSASRALPKLRKRTIAGFTASGDARIASRHSMRASGLGDETARGVKVHVAASHGDFNAYLYFWRARNVVAMVGTFDTTNQLDARKLLTIAERIDFRASR